MKLFSTFMDMISNKPEITYLPGTNKRRIQLPNGQLVNAKLAQVPIDQLTFRCKRCQKTYSASIEGGLVPDYEDCWICPKCLTPVEKTHAQLQAPAKSPNAAPGFKTIILDLLDNAHFFMVTPEAVFAKETAELDLDVAPPFETCWFQFPEPSETFTGVRFTSEGEVMYGMFLHEVSPQRYLFALILKDPVNPELLRLRGGFASEQEDHDIWHTIAFWLQPFANGSRTGIAKVNERFKYKSDGEKKLLKIKKVVYVYPKKMTREQSDDAQKRQIDFSHRWESRAHWRTLTPGKIGKNRAGEYCVAGKTFVMESVKGPEYLPLIKKTRIVLDPGKDENEEEGQETSRTVQTGGRGGKEQSIVCEMVKKQEGEEG